MGPEILIVGQGLAGTLLAWELERAGIAFAMVDRGHAGAASRVAAGIVNPITGRRLVKSWAVDALLPAARATYRELEATLGVRLWHEVRVRRFFADDRERRVFSEKRSTGELAPFAGSGDETGFWIEGAGRVDVAALLVAARARWRPREVEFDVHADAPSYTLAIDCTGLAGARNGAFDFVPWEFSKGEILEVAVEGLAPDVILNRRHWVAPVRPGIGWVGATHEPGVGDATPSPAARTALSESARVLLGQTCPIVDQYVSVRVNLPDKRPVAGRHPREPRLGTINGLGAKGALLAPMLARAWVDHLRLGSPFAAEISPGRFWR